MTKKHKIGKSRHLLETKKGVDENVKNILRMLGEENELAESEPVDSRNTLKKSKLSTLVKGFHEDYEHLHKHYKQLISKIENVGQSSTGSDSSDSDSEGDRSDNDVSKEKVDEFNEDNGWKQKLSKDHQGEEWSVETEIEKLKQNAEVKAKEISDLKQLLAKAINDNEATRVELSSDVTKLSSKNENLKLSLEAAKKEAGESVRTLVLKENENRTLYNEKQIIGKERDDLKISITDLDRKREDMCNQLQDTVEKCTLLSSRLEKAQLAEKEVQALLSENQKIKSDNMMLSEEYDNLKEHRQNLDNESSHLKADIAGIKAENISLIGENHSLESKLQLLRVEIDGITVEKEELLDNLNKERGAAGEEKEQLASEHSKCLNELEKAQSIVKEIEMELEATKVTLNNENAELKKEKESVALELKQLEASLLNLKNESEQQLERISLMQTNNEDLNLVNSNLHNEFAAAQRQNNEAVASIIDLESKLEQQNKQISNLQETIEDLKNDIMIHKEEKNAALVQVQKSEACLKDLHNEMEQQHNQISVLQQANEELQEKNSRLDRQLQEAENNLYEEITVLKGDKEQALDNLRQSNASVKTLESELEHQIEQISVLKLANEDLQKNNSNLTNQLENTMVSLHSENLALEEEKKTSLSKLQQSEASIKNLRIELQEGKKQILILHLGNEDLKNSIASLDKQLEESRTSLHAEIVALREEKETVLSELQQSHVSVSNLETAIQKQTESILALQQANDDLQKNNCILTEQFEEVKVELQKEIKLLEEEKHTILAQLKQSETSVKILESDMAQLKEDLSVQMENNSILDKQLEEAMLKVSDIHEQFNKVQAEAASQINDMNTNANELEKTIDILSSQKTKVEEDVRIMIVTCTENMSFMKEFEDRVQQKITDHETGLVVLRNSLRGIHGSCQRLQDAYNEVSTKACQLEVINKNQIEQIDQLEEKNKEILNKHRHLEEDKLYANKENTKLHKHGQELEVLLQQAQKKIKVTEAESKCKEESYMMAMETSQANIGHLEQQIRKFSGRISSLEETLMQIKESSELGVSKFADQLDELESQFSQSLAHFNARLFACSEELRFVENKVHDHLDEKKELLKEKDQMEIRLTEKEKMLSEMVINAAEAKEKTVQLEKTIEEKEDELASRLQEKREAIKQLSDAIDYHRNNSDDLIRYIRSHNRPRLPFCM